MVKVKLDLSKLVDRLEEEHGPECQRSMALLFNPCRRCAALNISRHLFEPEDWPTLFGDADAEWLRQVYQVEATS